MMLDELTTLGIFFGVETDRRPLFLVPSFEMRTFESLLPIDADVVTYDRNPETYEDAIASVITGLGLAGRRIGVDSSGIRFREILALQSIKPRVELCPVEKILEQLCLCKDEEEVSCIRRAIVMTEEALEVTFC